TPAQAAPAPASFPEPAHLPDVAEDGAIPAQEVVTGTGTGEEGPQEPPVPAVRGSEMMSVGGHLPYPKLAQDRGYTGTTVVEATVRANGSLASARVIQSSGYQPLDEVAVLYVQRRMGFQPAGSDYRLQVEVVFRRTEGPQGQAAYEVDVIARDTVEFLP